MREFGNGCVALHSRMDHLDVPTSLGRLGMETVAYSVTIYFTDGTYEMDVVAQDSATALLLAMQDARMASRTGAFYGEVTGWVISWLMG